MRCRWTGGRYGVGNRIKLRYTRAIIDAIHSGELKTAQTTATPIFNLAVRAAPCLPGLGGVVIGEVMSVISCQAKGCSQPKGNANQACGFVGRPECRGVPESILSPALGPRP